MERIEIVVVRDAPVWALFVKVTPVAELMKSEGRFREATPEQIAAAQQDVDSRWKLYNYYAWMKA